MATIARAAGDPRAFPDVEDILMGSSTPSDPPRRLLHTANTLHPFRVRSGWGVQESEKVARAIAIHRLAAQAEERGKWAKADYLWNLRDEQVAHLSDEQWAASARSCAFEDGAAEWRRRIIAELVLDTHCAFYNAYVTAGLARADAHFQRIDDISAHELSKEERGKLLGPARDAHIEECRRAGDFDGAISFARQRLEDHSQDLKFEREYTALVFERATAGLKADEPVGDRHVAALDTGIGTLTDALRAYPRMADAYDALASLHRLRAVQLANAGRLSTALLHIAKAQSYHADMPGLADEESTISEMMRNLRVQMQDVKEKLSANPDLALSPEGQRLRHEADAGFLHLTGYKGTQKDAQIRADAANARAFRLWRLAGLPEPPDRWAERAQALAHAVAAALANAHTDKASLQEVWREACAGEPDLSGVPFEALLKLAADSPQHDQPQTAAAEISEQMPVVRITTMKKRSAREPLTFWLFTRRDPLLKLAVATAMVAAVGAAGLTAKNAVDEYRRESAWNQLITAAGKGDDRQVVDAAQRFLSVPPSTNDAHVEEALELYEAALVRWLAALKGPLGADALQRLDEYRRLTAQVPRGGRT
jgi:hypothetical protein